MTDRSKRWDREDVTECEEEPSKCSCRHTHPNLEKEFQYKQLTKRLAEEKARLARKVKEPNDRYQTSLDNFAVDR